MLLSKEMLIKGEKSAIYQKLTCKNGGEVGTRKGNNLRVKKDEKYSI